MDSENHTPPDTTASTSQGLSAPDSHEPKTNRLALSRSEGCTTRQGATAFDLNDWAGDLSVWRIQLYWDLFPDHEVGITDLEELVTLENARPDELPDYIVKPTLVSADIDW